MFEGGTGGNGVDDDEAFAVTDPLVTEGSEFYGWGERKEGGGEGGKKKEKEREKEKNINTNKTKQNKTKQKTNKQTKKESPNLLAQQYPKSPTNKACYQ